MGESLDDMIALSRLRKEEGKARRQTNLATAVTDGWTQLSQHHFRKKLVGGGYVDWWPSTKKFAIIGRGASASRAKYRHGDPMQFIAKKGNLEWAE
jgi:hypothetical protein